MNWRHTSPLGHAEWAHWHLPDCSGDVVGQREVCQALSEAPRSRVADASIFFRSTEKVQVDFLSLGDAVALGAVDVSPKSSLLARVCGEEPPGV